MVSFVLRRMLALLPVLLLVAAFAFLVLRMVPGDPAAIIAGETATTAVRVNCFSPGPTRTKMRATAMPGEDPETLPPPEHLAAKLVEIASPAWSETGKLLDFSNGTPRLRSLGKPA